MTEPIPPCPVFNYPDLPWLPRTGIQGEGNTKFLTNSLFIETCNPGLIDRVMWCLSEHEVYVPELKKWLPSAWMAYIHAKDEYDALMKICGNIRQWERIKAMKIPSNRTIPFSEILESWQAEQAYLQRMKIKEALLSGVAVGGPGYTAAAKMLLQMVDNPKVGRPKKEKEKKDPAAEAADHVARMSEHLANG